MNNSLILGILQNTALLLALSLVFDYFHSNKKWANPYLLKVTTGLIIGAIGIILMLTPWTLTPGIVFDTRSILLSVSGLFFGPIATAIAMIMTGTYRYLIGGDGIYMGIAVIFSSGIIGILWKKFFFNINRKKINLNLLLFGAVVHIVMLACILFLPGEKQWTTFKAISLPVIIFYPLGSLLLGKLLLRQLLNCKAKSDLKDSEKKLSDLFQNSPYGIIVCRLISDDKGTPIDFVHLEANIATSEQTGYNLNDIVGKRASEMVTHDVVSKLVDIYGAVVRTGILNSYVEYFSIYNRTLEVTAFHLHDELFILNFMNISHLVTVEKTLEESENKFKTLFQSMNEGFAYHELIFDPEGKPVDYRILDVNPAFEKILGISRDKVIDKPATIAYGVETAPYLSEYANVALKNEPVSFQTFFEPLVKHFMISAFSPQKGKFATVFSDITEIIKLEEQIKQEQELLSAIFDNIEEGLVVCDENGILRRFNEAARRFHGLPEKNIPAEEWAEYYDLFMPDGITPMQKDDIPLFRALSDGKVKNAELMIIPKDGEPKSFISIGKRLVDENNNTIGAVAAMHDITERKKAEEKIACFSRIFEDSLNEIYLFDAATLKFTQVNSAAQQNLGYSMEEFYKMTPLDFKSEFTLESFEKLIAPLRNGDKEKIVFETVHKRKDKTFYPVEVHLQLLKHESEMIFAAIIMDITDRIQAEKALQLSEERMRSMFEEAPLGISLIDSLSGQMYEVNPRFAEITGRNREEMLTIDWMSITHPDDLQEDLDNMDQLNAGKISGFNMNKRYIKPDGSIVWIDMTIAPMIVEDKTQPRHLCMIEDITERKKAEEEIRKLNEGLEQRVIERTKVLEIQTTKIKESQTALTYLLEDVNESREQLKDVNVKLEAANKELESFSYSVSHDLKAPLRGIDGYSQLLLDTYYEELDPEAQEFLRNIRKSTAQMNLLIEDLLSYSRIERQDFLSESIDLKVLIDSLLQYYSNIIKAKKIKVKLSFPEIFKLVTDKDGINIVMRNLIDNAIKFSSHNKKSQIEIGGSESNSKWLIFVKDNGIGFDMKYHDRIYKIFQRLQLAEEYEGTGIGLAMVSKAMRRMNGRIWAESAPNEGACFFIEINKRL